MQMTPRQLWSTRACLQRDEMRDYKRLMTATRAAGVSNSDFEKIMKKMDD